MSDLEKVIGLAEEKKQKATEELNARHESREMQTRAFEKMSARVKKFAQDLKGKASIYISADSEIKRLIVSIGSGPPIIQRPYCRIEIIPTAWGEEKYNCRIKMYNSDEFSAGTHTLEELVALLSENAAEFITKRAKQDYEVPYWYMKVGEVISWPLFIIGWIACYIIFGFSGFLLGWLPSIILRYTAKYLWLPFLIFVFYKMQ